ncbi:MAG: diaminopropionate ammonia-lyase [Pseudomonadota bacterium]
MSELEEFAGNVRLADQISQSLVKTAYPKAAQEVLSTEHVNAAFDEITHWPGYRETPLVSLDRLSAVLDCSAVHYKDESQRFGLGSFKALGGAYAVLWLVAREYHKKFATAVTLGDIRRGDHGDFAGTLTITTATDGNHGRSVAWGARNAGCDCRIYIHREVSEGRKAAMEALGAEVVRIDGDYDDSVRQCAQESAENGWFVVSDTSYEGYRDVPQMVMAGYTVMAGEVLSQLTRPLTHVFIQAGVGGLAAAVCARLWMHYGDARPRIIVVESEHAACWLDSVRAGEPTAVQIDTETVMAGLSCGEVSQLAWQVMSLCADDVVTLADNDVAGAMKLFADGAMSGSAIEAGECAVPGVLSLMAICQKPELKESFGIDANSEVLVIGCEGATDQAVYRALIDSV